MIVFETPEIKVIKLKLADEIASLELYSESGDINDYNDENMLPKN